MSNLSELNDLRTDLWGTCHHTAGERAMNTEQKLQEVIERQFPKFDDRPWSCQRDYQPFTFVKENGNQTFVSLKYVPSGILLSNTEYWQPWDITDRSQAITTPLVVNSPNLMTDKNRNYVLSTDGYVYSWNGTRFQKTVKYMPVAFPGIQSIEVDSTGKVSLILED